MDALITQEKEVKQRQTEYETCPACTGKRKRTNLLCWKCKKIYDEQIARAENEGKVVTTNLFMWAYAQAKKNLELLFKELAEAEEDKKQIVKTARKIVKTDLASRGIAFVDRNEFGRLTYQKFVGIAGQEKSEKISRIVNIHPRKIESLSRLIAGQEEKMQQSVE